MRDAARLQDNVERGRCLTSACLVFDDECYFEYYSDPAAWPRDVALLLVSPCELRRRRISSPATDAAYARAQELGASSPKVERWKRRMTWEEGDVQFIRPGNPGYGEVDPSLNVDPRTIELIERRKAEHSAQQQDTPVDTPAEQRSGHAKKAQYTEAAEIFYGPGTRAEKRARLMELPFTAEIAGYMSSFARMDELESPD